ncbi:MAG TPA: hypothetical protein ENN03_01480 [bacterium]|nr:hypothetical protein [bacterium]
MGKMKKVTDIPRESCFQVDGIGLCIAERGKNSARLIVYDHGGIYDPLDRRVPGDHYATTHFALLGSIIRRFDPSAVSLKAIKNAAHFQFRTGKDEYKFSRWGFYHWDFKNMALLETLFFLDQTLSRDEKNTWRTEILRNRENLNNPLTNWVAMRAWSALMRYKLWGKKADIGRLLFRLILMERARRKDGCYEDYRNLSRPIQYHVYTLALIARMIAIWPLKHFIRHFNEGVDYFIKHIDPDGCFNYQGRGQEQIFGYGAGLYVLETAKKLNPSREMLYQRCADLLWRHLSEFQVAAKGYYHLVLNHHDDAEKMGWYDYHHLTVYNAFLGVWLALAHSIQKKTAEIQPVRLPRDHVYFSRVSQTLLLRRPSYFIAVDRGAPEYLSEPGVTPCHLWFRDLGWIFSCPGGASPSLYGKQYADPNIHLNFFSPLYKNGDQWFVPVQADHHEWDEKRACLKVFCSYGAFGLERTYSFTAFRISVKDIFTFKESGNCCEFRPFNFPVNQEKFRIAASKNRLRLILNKKTFITEITHSDFPAPIQLIEKIHTAKGTAVVAAVRIPDFSFTRNEIKSICFSLHAGH